MSASSGTYASYPQDRVEQLEGIMRSLVVCYEQILTFAKQRKDAIRSADTNKLGSVIRQENTLVQQVADIEKKRIEVVRVLAESLGSTKREQTTVGWIASRIGSAGESLNILADHLKQTISRVQQLNAVTKQASEMLAKHMQGILQTVAKDRSFVKTYSSAGSMAQPRGASTGLNAVA